jgi:hypothetical protein
MPQVDLGLNAHGNARKYHDRKKHARTKEQKTRDVSKQALKSVEKATHQKIKEVEIRAQITKARKTYWFEKVCTSANNPKMLADWRITLHRKSVVGIPQ